MAFGSCSKSQLALIFLNTFAFFIAGTVLGYGIYVYSYMRTTNGEIVGVCLGASVATMIATAMGAWGALLKKHGVLKAYFYFLLLINLVLLVEGTLCIIVANDVNEYVDANFLTVKDAMPDSQCSLTFAPGWTITSAVETNIASCKKTMTDTLRDNLRYMGVCCIVMAFFMVFGLIAAGRLLTWDRLTGPLLNGGASMMVAYGIMDLVIGFTLIVEEKTDSIRNHNYSGFIAIVAGFMAFILAAVGIQGMRAKSIGLLLVYQVLAFLLAALLLALCITAALQSDDITSWTGDNFDSGKNIRSDLDKCSCNNDDYPVSCGQTYYAGTVPSCNERTFVGNLKYYTCTGGSCILDTSNALAKTFCLPTNLCVDDTINKTEANLAAIAISAGFFIVYLAICLAASINVRMKMQEEESNASTLHASSPEPCKV